MPLPRFCILKISAFRYFILVDLLQDIDAFQINYLAEETESPARKKALLQMQRALVKTRELGDEKLQVVSHIIEHVENRTRQLEQDLENLGLFVCFLKNVLIIHFSSHH